jgi:hypothetical protein
MARMRPEILDDFLTRPIIGVLATTRREGRPYQIPVWFLWKEADQASAAPPARVGPSFKDGVFWITGTYTRVWCKHIFADPRVSLCIEAADPVARYVAVDCKAVPVEQDIWPISTELARKYVGGRPGATEADVERFMANMKTEPRLLFRLTPLSWRAIDLTAYTGSRGDIAYQRSRAGGSRE